MNKKGFTLIELLAVIVILAVIALIATPLITNTISTARKNADRESARAYVSAVEEKITEAMLEYPNLIVATTAQTTVGEFGCTECDATNKIKVDFKGTAPLKSTLTWDDGKVSGTLKFKNGCFDIDAKGKITNSSVTAICG